MKQYSYLIILLLSIAFSAPAQNAADTTEAPKTSITLATLYSSNVNYYGQTSTQKLPYVLGYAAVKFPSGIWLSGQTYKLLNAESGISGLGLSLGYDFNLSKNLTGSLSYGRSFYPDSSQLLQSINDDMASASLDYHWKWLTTGLTADYGFGDGGVLYTTFNASKIVDLGLSLSSKDYFTFEPVIEVIGGTQRFYSESETQDSGSQNEEQNGGLVDLDRIIGKNGKPLPGNRKGNIPGSKEGEGTVVATTSFNVVAYNFTLPIVYNRANYSIEASYQGSVLSKSVSDSQKIQSFFNLGFYYMF
ncbi:hypothetical protein ACFSJU_18665 [Paradesertivirga mongoliensis]|uniref:Outer membrane protein beta-barrel domain-containing protein n=1 Tax=Paradesertivirga mongoliensis TaxID=2100740 RepID=A0ABW4ZR74_9SPHI|nr:hypothetical protein [Pedobacter mongoliensis]